MSIRVKYIHFTKWVDVVTGLVKNGVDVSTADDARIFLSESSNSTNPFYYFIVFVKESQEIYTHGKFYDCSKYNDADVRNLINNLTATTNAALENKANKDDFDALVEEVSENEFVIAKSLSDLDESKLDVSALSDLATKNELSVLNANIELKANNDDLDDLIQEVSDIEKSTTESLAIIDNKFNNYVSTETFNNRVSVVDASFLNLNADNIKSGTISIDRLPHGALEQLHHYSTQELAQQAVIDGNVQLGDTVQINNGPMYICTNVEEEEFVYQFTEYVAGTAASVPWSGITGKPNIATQEELNVIEAKIPSMEGYATEAWVNNKGFITNNVTGDFSASGMVRGNYLSTGYIQISSNIDASLRTSIFGDAGNHWGQIKAFRTGGSASYGSLAGGYAAGILFAMNDTHGFIQLPEAASKAGEAVIGGGTGENIKWSAKLLHSLNYSSYALPITGGTINGDLTTSGIIKSNSVICSKGRLRVSAADSDGNFGYLKAEVYNTNRGVLKIGTNYGANTNILDAGSDNDAICMYYSSVGIGRTFTGDELRTNQKAGVYLYVNGIVQSSSTFNGTDFVTTSDSRLKDFVNDVEVDFDKLKSIPKKYYYWKDKSIGEDLQIGTSAQDLMKVYPTCVSYDEVRDRYSVNYQKLSIIALAAIDKLHDKIVELESKINHK